MAKQTRKPKSGPAARPPRDAPVPVQPVKVPVPAPAFWFGFEVPWTKLVVARVVIFGLLAIDALLAIRHAPRYGAGGFNVAQIPGLDGLGPTRLSYLVCELFGSFLFAFAAFGIGTRIVVPIAAALYAWLYLGSQLDSYQHHYLVALILGLACFVTWAAPKDASPAKPIRSWALRLILVQLGILYLYAAVSKLDPAWLDGRTLGGQIFANPGALVDVRGLIDGTIGMRAVSNAVVIVELSLAAMVWNPRTWFIAAPLGILFHLGIVFTGLEIGLFAWLMIGFYILVIPDRILIWIGESRVGAAIGDATTRLLRWLDGHAIAGAVATLGGLAFAFLTRTDHAFAVALAIFIIPYLVAVATNRVSLVGRIGVAQLVAFGLWFAVDRGSSVTADYYKFWGGSSRRLGDLAASEEAYARMVVVTPEEPAGHYQLGRLLLARGDELDGMAELHETEALAPTRARAWLEEARYLEAHQRHQGALEKAKKALELEPKSSDAQALMSTLTGAAKAAGSAAPTKDDE